MSLNEWWSKPIVTVFIYKLKLYKVLAKELEPVCLSFSWAVSPQSVQLNIPYCSIVCIHYHFSFLIPVIKISRTELSKASLSHLPQTEVIRHYRSLLCSSPIAAPFSHKTSRPTGTRLPPGLIHNAIVPDHHARESAN